MPPAPAFLDSARQFHHDDQDSCAAKPALRSVGVVQLSGTRRLEENVLAPSTTRHLLRRWLGDPDQSAQSAQPLVERVSRHCQLSAEEMFQRVLQTFGPDTNARRAPVTSRLHSFRTGGIDDQSIAEFAGSTLRSEDSEAEADAVVGKLQREMSIRLVDGRLDFAAAIMSVQLMAAQMRRVADQLTAETGSPQETTDTPQQSTEATADRAEQILHEFAARTAAKCARRICERLSLLEQRLSIRAMVLAKAIRSVNDGRKGGSNAWDDMHTPLRQQFERVLQELHGLCAPNWLVKLIGENGGTVKPDQMVSAISEAALPLICRAVMVANGEDDGDSKVTEVTTPPDTSGSNSVAGTIRFSPVGGADSIGATASLAAVTADIGSAKSAEAPVLTIEDAVNAVRPALLCCGGYQRLMLVVGSKAEQDVLEPQVQQYHQGSLTTVIIESAPPMLIHERSES